jgi:hypothetical protein
MGPILASSPSGAAELTAPGYWHDVFSCWHPLFVGGPAYTELKEASGSACFKLFRN